MAPAMAPAALTRLSSTSMAMGHTAEPIMIPMKLYIQPMPMPRFWRSAARQPWMMPYTKMTILETRRMSAPVALGFQYSR